jgi:hypothetical protein
VPGEEGGMRSTAPLAAGSGAVSRLRQPDHLSGTADPSTPTSVWVWLGKSDVEKLEDIGLDQVHRYLCRR